MSTVLDFRRQPEAPVRRRRARTVQSMRELFLLLTVVGAPALVYAMAFGSGRFVLRESVVDGHLLRVSRPWITAQIEPFRGQNLLRVPLGALRKRLAQNPWISEVQIRKEFPNRLRLRVVEKQPAALSIESGRLVYVDSQGRPIATTDPGSQSMANEKLLHLNVSNALSDRRAAFLGAFAAAATLSRVGPQLSSQLVSIEILADDELGLTFRNLPFRVLVSAGHADAQIRSLLAILPEVLGRYDNLESIDFRFEREAVLRLAPDREAGSPQPEVSAVSAARERERQPP
jgi:cell division septal protein FtsQ